MITQQAKDHAQACLDATKEAAILHHMGDAQKAAYMAILADDSSLAQNLAAVVAKLRAKLDTSQERVKWLENELEDIGHEMRVMGERGEL